MRLRRAIVVLLLWAALGCRDRYTEIQISPSAEISNHWVVIRAPKPLTWTQPVEEFSFGITSPHEIGLNADIVMPNGEKVVPDVELIMDNGTTCEMDQHGFWGQDMFFTRRQRPASALIVAIRIRSTSPLHISNLRWRGYDPARVKR